MRLIVVLSALALLAGCQTTPEDQQPSAAGVEERKPGAKPGVQAKPVEHWRVASIAFFMRASASSVSTFRSSSCAMLPPDFHLTAETLRRREEFDCFCASAVVRKDREGS